MFDITGFRKYPLQISFFSDFFSLSEKSDGKKAVGVESKKNSLMALGGPMQGASFTFSTRLHLPTCLLRLQSPYFMGASHMANAYIEVIPQFNRTTYPMSAENGRELGPKLVKELHADFIKEIGNSKPGKCIYPPMPEPTEPLPPTLVFPEMGFIFDFCGHRLNKNVIQNNEISCETAASFAKLLDILLTLPTIISGPLGNMSERRYSGRLAGTYELSKSSEISYYGLAPAWLRSKHLAGILFGQAFLAMNLMSAPQAVANIQETFPSDLLNDALNRLEEGAIAEAKARLLFVLKNIPEEIAEDRSLVNPLSRLEWLWITKNSKSFKKYLRPFSDGGLAAKRLGSALPPDLKSSYEAFARENPNP